MTMNDTWGYKKFDHNWKSTETLIHNLVDIAAKGGNYLLNVGPTSEGIIPPPSVERLAEMGDWMRVNGEAIYGAKMWKHYREGETIRYTSNGAGTLYAISLEWPGDELNLKLVQPKEGSEIHLLGYEKPLSWSMDAANGLLIQLPKALQEDNNRPCKHAFVFKIETE